MGYSERKDMGFPVAGEKARKPDEFLTRSQVQPGRNIYFDYLANWDIRINAMTSGNIAGVRNMIAYVRTTLRPVTDLTKVHYDLQDPAPDGISMKGNEDQFFGTALFQDVYHNWNLPSKDHFTFSIEDLRDGSSIQKVDISAMQSLPHVVGVDNNRVRIWATNPKHLTRFDPRLWVDTEGGLMKNTIFPSRADDVADDNPYKLMNQATHEHPPFYAIKIYEITDVSANIEMQMFLTDGVQ